MKLITLILQDLEEPVSYLPQGVLVGSACVAGAFLWSRHARGREEKSGAVSGMGLSCFLMAVYLTVLFRTAFFSREPGSRIGVDLGLFDTWGMSWQARAYVIENILFFIPFGLLLPGCILRQKGSRPDRGGCGRRYLAGLCLCTGLGCFFSICLELMQLVTQRGYCQLDDVVMNTLGTALGYVLFWFLTTGIR